VINVTIAFALVIALAGRALAEPVVAKVDLREQQTPIRNQGQRGTCSDFAVVAAMEAAFKRAGHGDLHLSEEFSHDVAKMMYLEEPDAKRPANQAEDHVAGLGGGNPIILMHMLCHGLALPEDRFLPYRMKDYPLPANPDWKSQFAVSSFNLSPLHLPTAALQADRYFSLQSFSVVPHATDPLAIEKVLRQGHEVVWTFTVAGDRKGPVWKYTGPPGPKDGDHATLIVGYDRTDPANPYFIVKNSWGKTATPGADGFTYIAYDYLNYGKEAAYITGVRPPESRPAYAFLGRWYATFPGRKGILDLYRMPGVMQWKFKDGKGQPLADRRVGTFYEDGNLARAYRVNGTVQGAKLVVTINWSQPSLTYDQFGPYRVNLTVAEQNPNQLTGAVVGPNGTAPPVSAQRLLSPEAFADQPPSAETLMSMPELATK
jgi:hypothetical protein